MKSILKASNIFWGRERGKKEPEEFKRKSPNRLVVSFNKIQVCLCVDVTDRIVLEDGIEEHKQTTNFMLRIEAQTWSPPDDQHRVEKLKPLALNST